MHFVTFRSRTFLHRPTRVSLSFFRSSSKKLTWNGESPFHLLAFESSYTYARTLPLRIPIVCKLPENGIINELSTSSRCTISEHSLLRLLLSEMCLLSRSSRLLAPCQRRSSRSSLCERSIFINFQFVITSFPVTMSRNEFQ